MAPEPWEATLNRKTNEYGHLALELTAVWSAIGRGGVTPDLAEWVCTGYSLVMCAQASSYFDRPNALLDDTKPREGYLGSFHVLVSVVGRFLHDVVVDSNEEDEILTPRLQPAGEVFKIFSYLLLSSCVYLKYV